MRISTKTMFESGVGRINDLQSSLQKTQQQLSTGKRILTPSDDPVAAARALEVTQSKSMNTQFGANRQSAKDSLNMEEGALQSVTSLLQDAQTAAVQAGNGTLDDSQRKYIATQLSQSLNQLIGLANTRDGTGNFIFAGFQNSTQPFAQTAAGVQYQGDQGQRQLQVASARQMSLGDSGDTVFQQIPSGNGVFSATAATGNTGTGVITGTATGSGPLASTYAVVFSNGGTSYSVYDTKADPTMSSAIASGTYTSGQAINIGTAQVEVTGTPANGDRFTVAPSTSQSIFSTLQNLIGLLNTPATGDSGKTALANGLNDANANLSNALDNVLTVRASVGARLKELDALDSAGDDRDQQFAQTLSNLQDVDYVKAISQLTQTQTTLQAAQQSFVKITGLSLFNYLT